MYWRKQLVNRLPKDVLGIPYLRQWSCIWRRRIPLCIHMHHQVKMLAQNSMTNSILFCSSSPFSCHSSNLQASEILMHSVPAEVIILQTIIKMLTVWGVGSVLLWAVMTPGTPESDSAYSSTSWSQHPQPHVISKLCQHVRLTYNRSFEVIVFASVKRFDNFTSLHLVNHPPIWVQRENAVQAVPHIKISHCQIQNQQCRWCSNFWSSVDLCGRRGCPGARRICSCRRQPYLHWCRGQQLGVPLLQVSEPVQNSTHV